MMSAGPFCGRAEMQWKCFLGIQFIYMAKRDFGIHLITRHNILEYMQIAIIQTQAADFENSYLGHSQNIWPRLYINASKFTKSEVS